MKSLNPGNHLKPIDRRAVIQDLHLMIDFRLFGDRPYLADRETCEALDRNLKEMGLSEHVPGEHNCSRSTALVRELQEDLIMVFIGLRSEAEVPAILEKYFLIDEHETTKIYDLLGTCDDPKRAERVLRPVVQKAYRDHYHPSGLLN